MATTIYYYTGTGNSLWVARTIADRLREKETVSQGRAIAPAGNRVAQDASGVSPVVQLVSIADCGTGTLPECPDVMGLVFPVYIWGVSAPVLRFVRRLRSVRPPSYCFAIAVNAGQVSNTLVELKSLLRKERITLASGFEIALPSNYLPWGGAEPQVVQEKLFAEARLKIDRIARCVSSRDQRPVEKGPLWQRILFTFFHNISFDKVPTMDRKFWIDERCNKCGVCARLCPAENITMRNGKPSWNHRCEQCLACIQWCPMASIQYGKKTVRYERYHHPEIMLSDVLKRGPGRRNGLQDPGSIEGVGR